MSESRPELPAALERDLRLEVGGVCPFAACRMPAQENCHIWDRSKGGPDVFGNLLRACAAHHHEHTAGRIPSHDLRVIKARLAWVNERYTQTECLWLQVFSRREGMYFKHPASGRACLRFLQADGYAEIYEPSKLEIDSCPVDVWRLTRIGKWFTRAWVESGAYPLSISP